MTHTLTLMAALATFSVTAQPTLLSSELPPIGTEETYHVISDLTVIDTTIQGANATWSFGALTSNGTDIQYTFMNPAATPYASSFPAATYARHGTNDDYYDYYVKTSSYLEIIGFVGPWSSAVYSDPQRELVFPLTLGTTNHDTWANSLSSLDGDYDIACVGYGTLTLPSGTFTNVLMVRLKLTELGTVPGYQWLSADNGVLLLSYLDGDGLFYPDFGYFLDEVSIGVEEHALLRGLNYVNPVTDMITLSFESGVAGALDYDLTNAVGQVVRSGTFGVSDGGGQVLHVSVPDLEAGVYHLTLRSRDSGIAPKVVRLVKQ